MNMKSSLLSLASLWAVSYIIFSVQIFILMGSRCNSLMRTFSFMLSLIDLLCSIVSTESLSRPSYIRLVSTFVEVHLASKFIIIHNGLLRDYTWSKDGIIVIGLRNLCLVSLMQIDTSILLVTNNIRSNLSSHAGEHNMSFSISTSFLIQIHYLLLWLTCINDRTIGNSSYISHIVLLLLKGKASTYLFSNVSRVLSSMQGFGRVICHLFLTCLLIL